MALPFRLLASPAAGLVVLPAVRRAIRRRHLLASRPSRAGWPCRATSSPRPSIPLSEKNRELGAAELAAVLQELRIERDKPLLVQVSPFTRDHDPLDAINVYRLVKRHHDVRLVLAGTGQDDRRRPGGAGRRCARRPSAIRTSSSSSCRPRRSARSTRSSARRPSCCRCPSGKTSGSAPPRPCGRASPSSAAAVGGLAQLIIRDVTGYIVHSVEGAAFRDSPPAQQPGADSPHGRGRPRARAPRLPHHPPPDRLPGPDGPPGTGTGGRSRRYGGERLRSTSACRPRSRRDRRARAPRAGRRSSSRSRMPPPSATVAAAVRDGLEKHFAGVPARAHQRRCRLVRRDAGAHRGGGLAMVSLAPRGAGERARHRAVPRGAGAEARPARGLRRRPARRARARWCCWRPTSPRCPATGSSAWPDRCWTGAADLVLAPSTPAVATTGPSPTCSWRRWHARSSAGACTSPWWLPAPCRLAPSS